MTNVACAQLAPVLRETQRNPAQTLTLIRAGIDFSERRVKQIAEFSDVFADRRPELYHSES